MLGKNHELYDDLLIEINTVLFLGQANLYCVE